MAYTRVSPGKWKDSKTGKIVNSTTDPNKSKPKTETKPTGKGTTTTTTTSPKAETVNQGTTTDLVTGDAKGTGLSSDLINTAQYFGDLFTKNVNPRTIGVNPSLQTDQQNQAGAAQGLYDNAGITAPGTQTGLNALQNTYNSAGIVDPNEQLLLSQLTNNALNGYTPEQLQVARESGRSGITNTLQGALRGAMGQAASNNVNGPAAYGLTLPGQQIAANSLGNLERDLFLSNIDFMGANNREARTGFDTINKRTFDQRKAAGTDLFEGNYTNDQANWKNKLDAFDTLTNFTNGLVQQDISLQASNNDSLNAYELGKIGAFTGGLSFGDSSKTNQQLLDLQKKLTSSGGSGSSSGSKAPRGAAPTTNFVGSGGFQSSTPQPTQPGGPTSSSFSTSKYATS